MNERSCRLDDIEKGFVVVLPTPSGAKPHVVGAGLLAMQAPRSFR